MANLSDKINAARKEGYSDDEIISHLSSTDLRSKIEAAKKEGYSSTEIADHLGGAQQGAPEVSGMFDQFRAGLESNTEQPGQTIETFGKTAGSQGLQDTGKWLRDLTSAPDNFVSASDRFVNPKAGDSYVDPVLGFGWGNAPGALAEQTGQLTGDVAVRSGGGLIGGGIGGAATGGPGAPVGAAVGAFAAPALLEFMRTAGPVAQARAQNNGREVPSWEDWQAAAATAGVSGLLNSIGIGKIGLLNEGIKEVGKKTATGVVKEAATETAKKATKEGVTEFGQSLTEQTGSTLGTDKGLNIDLKQAVGEGVLGFGSAGMVDTARNAKPVFNTANDIRSVDSQMRNNPDAQMQAETTLDVNNIADRMAGSGKAPVSQEVNRYVSDIKKQINEAIDGQNLDPEDKKALKGGMQDATGLTQDRLDEIAGRSENPSEIKSLARRIQVVREMTVQKQSNKGWRGWAATAASLSGVPLGAYIGNAVGNPVAGAAIGQAVGTSVARKLRGSQTQGNNIDNLVGKKQARRAAMLLDRYGPSEATTALNTLTEKAAANKAQAEADAQAKKDFEETMSRIRFQNSLREKSRRAMEQATTKEEKAKAAAEKQKLDLATREERLKGLAFRSQINQARAQKLAQDLEAKKSMNALTIEMAQTRKDLKEAEAVAKADKLNRDADFAVKNLNGKLEMLAIDIQRRQEALKKAEIATKRAEKMASKAPASAGPVLSRIRNMNSKWAQSVQEDANIGNKPAYQSAVQYLDTLRQEAQNTIKAEPNEKVRTLLREALTDILSHKNNWEARASRFERAMRDAKQLGGDAPMKLHDTLYQLAHYKVQSGGREDFGSPSDTQQQDIPFDMPPASSTSQWAQPEPPVQAPVPPAAEPALRVAPQPAPVREAPKAAETPSKTLASMIKKVRNGEYQLGPFGFGFNERGGVRYLRVRDLSGNNLLQHKDGAEPSVDVTDIWSSEDANQHEHRQGNKVGSNSLEDNVPTQIAPILRDWLSGKIDDDEAISRIKNTKIGQ